jgi:hypothetical protein
VRTRSKAFPSGDQQIGGLLDIMPRAERSRSEDRKERPRSEKSAAAHD